MAGGWVGRRVIVPYGTTLHDGSQPVEDPPGDHDAFELGEDAFGGHSLD